MGAAGRLNTRSTVIDGEVVVVTPQGDTDFAALESYVSSKRPDRALHVVTFYAFDVLHLDGFDLRDVALIDRKRVLAELLSELDPHSPIKFSEHLDASGPDVYRNACELELEGIVSKRKDGRYRSGRNDAWIKLTCRHRDTFLVAGLAFVRQALSRAIIPGHSAKWIVFWTTGFGKDTLDFAKRYLHVGIPALSRSGYR